jgi:RHS repeat-associated protein
MELRLQRPGTADHEHPCRDLRSDVHFCTAQRVTSKQAASPADIAHYVHDIWGNIIAETDGGGATGTTGTVREYIYLPEAEIAPTMGARTVVDRPVAVVDAVNTATPVTWFVHVDHLHRPIKMTNAAKAVVWDAVWLPWGGVHSITGSATLDARFPGQWFQLETGLHYNWHRSYDPTIGRYTQPDPLGFVDGPSVYGYAKGQPQAAVDKDGRSTICMNPAGCAATVVINACRFGIAVLMAGIETKRCKKVRDQCNTHCSDIAMGSSYWRCLNQCLYDNNCGGIDYDDDGGWSPDNPPGRKPWK